MVKDEFKLILLSNAFFVALYLLWNWAEYSGLNGMYQVAVNSHFPVYIQFGGTKAGYDILVFNDTNFGLVFFILAVAVNLNLAFKLQKKTANPKQ